MALAANDYEGHLKEFNDKYGMAGYDLKKMAQIDEKFRYVNNFLLKDSVDGPSAQFIDWVSKIARNYFENHSQFSSDWKKNLFKFNIREFVDDFENVAKAKYLSELEKGQEPNRKKYAGAESQQIIRRIAPYFQAINKPLPTVWMERMKKGTMDLTEIQQLCENLTGSLKDSSESKMTLMAEFTRIVAAREAVRQLRESRPHGFLGAIWWLFNFRINARERDCLQALDTCIKTWEAEQFNTEKVLSELMGKTALGRPVNAAEKASQPQTQATEQIQNEPSLSNEPEQVVKAPQMGPVAKQLDETLKKVDIYAISQELHEKLPENGQMEILRTMGFQTLWKTATNNIKQINADFDSAIAKGADPKMEMDHVVRKVFVDTFKAIKTWGDYSAMTDKIEATKILAQTILERHTALALHPDQLGDAVKGYVEQYTDTMKELSNKNKDFVSEMETFEFKRMNGVSSNSVSNNNNEIKADKIESEEMDLNFGVNDTDDKEKVFDDDNNPFKEEVGFEKGKRVDLDDSVRSEEIDLNI